MEPDEQARLSLRSLLRCPSHKCQLESIFQLIPIIKFSSHRQFLAFICRSHELPLRPRLHIIYKFCLCSRLRNFGNRYGEFDAGSTYIQASRANWRNLCIKDHQTCQQPLKAAYRSDSLFASIVSEKRAEASPEFFSFPSFFSVFSIRGNLSFRSSFLQKCRNICGLGCVNCALERA